MAEEKTQDLLMTESTAEQPLKWETFAVVSKSVESSKAADTKVKRNSSMSEGSNNRASQISDTESMEPGQDEEEYDEDVEPDSIPSNFGSAFASVQQGSDQTGLGGACAFLTKSSMSKASASETMSEPLTVAQQITEMYQHRRRSEEADFVKTMERVSILEQEMEMLSLQKKDLTQEVKLLKEENDCLRSTPSGVMEDQNRCLVEQVKALQENLRQAVERVYHYQSRCEKFEILQAERVHAGPKSMCAAETCNSLPSPEISAEPDTFPCLQELSFSLPGLKGSDDKVDEIAEEKEGEEEEEKEDSDRK